jgi:type I restriction enzyme M protein
LRGDYKQHEYGQVILPFTLLRRLDYVLEPTKAAVLRELERRKGSGVPAHDFPQGSEELLTTPRRATS